MASANSVNIFYTGNRSTVTDELKGRIETLRRDAERFAVEERDYSARAKTARHARQDAERLKDEYEAVVASLPAKTNWTHAHYPQAF